MQLVNLLLASLSLQLAMTGAPASSHIYVFTDAVAKDIDLKDTIVALIRSTKSTVNCTCFYTNLNQNFSILSFQSWNPFVRTGVLLHDRSQTKETFLEGILQRLQGPGFGVWGPGNPGFQGKTSRGHRCHPGHLHLSPGKAIQL